MTTQTALPQAIFPDLPRGAPAVDKEGNFSDDWSLGFSLLFQALQSNLSNEGFKFPPLTADQIATIQAVYTPLIGSPLPQNAGMQQFIPDISGANVFDSTNRVPKIFIITYDGDTPPNILTAAWYTYTLT
jgi:hypothetical protein